MKDPWEWDESDLLSLIENQVPEGLHLDYKQAEGLDKSDKKKEELSKDVAAFANSDGGTLVYGIVEDPKTHLPERIDNGYDSADINKDWIEQVINTRIQRRIDGVRITTINLTKAPGRVAYVVHVPQSIDAPHQSSDKRYYKRFNFQSVAMEDYEIRDVSRRLKYPRFSVQADLMVRFESRPTPRANCMTEIFLKVEGNVSARDLFVTVEAPTYEIPPYSEGAPDWRPTSFNGKSYGFGARRPIHPGEVVRLFYAGDMTSSLRAECQGQEFVGHEWFALLISPGQFIVRVYSQDQPPHLATIDFTDWDLRNFSQEIVQKNSKCVSAIPVTDG